MNENKQFRASVVTWEHKGLRSFITVHWEAGAPPRSGELKLHDAEGVHRLFLHEVEVGQEPPQVVLVVGAASEGMKRIAHSLKVTS